MEIKEMRKSEFTVYDKIDRLVSRHNRIDRAIEKLLKIKYGQVIDRNGDCMLTTMGVYNAEHGRGKLNSARCNLLRQLSEWCLSARVTDKFEELFGLDLTDKSAEDDNYILC